MRGPYCVGPRTPSGNFARVVPAGPAQARARLVLGHFHARRRRQVELPLFGVLHAFRLAQRRAAAAALRRHVLLDGVRVVSLLQRHAWVPGLPARALAGAAPGALRAPLHGRPALPVAGGRLGAIGTVQAQLPLDLGHALLQGCVPVLQALDLGPADLFLGAQPEDFLSLVD